MGLFSKKVSDSLLKEAIAIGDTLIARAKSDEQGIYWETLSSPTPARPGHARRVNETIYSGVAGILFFLKELYKHTHNEKYREAALAGCHWLIGYTERVRTRNYAFITGRIGTAYVINQMGVLSGSAGFRQYSLSIAKGALPFIRGHSVNEYINGVAGSAWGLLLIYQNDPESWILDYLQEAVNKILSSVAVYRKSFYWDRNEHQVRGLCGFSHGSSGIAGLFCELGYYFDNPDFYAVAEYALRYENYFFDPVAGQWPDFRKHTIDAAAQDRNEQQYHANDLEFFNRTKDMSAWCHGNIGIGLAQNRFHQCTGRMSLRNVHLSIRKHMDRKWEMGCVKPLSYNLCHGIGGNMDLFISRLYSGGRRDKTMMEYLGQVVHRFLRRDKNEPYLSGHAGTTEEDESLFVGMAGVGYFALRCVDPGLTSSILYPESTGRQKAGEALPSIYCPDVGTVFGKACYPRTMAARAAGAGVRECKDLLKLERYRVTHDLKSNNFYLYTQTLVEGKKRHLAINKSRTYFFQLRPGARVFTIRSSRGECFIVTYPTYRGMEDMEVSRPVACMLDTFRRPKSTVEAFEEMLELFSGQQASAPAILAKLQEQLTAMIAAGLLIATETIPYD